MGAGAELDGRAAYLSSGVPLSIRPGTVRTRLTASAVCRKGRDKRSVRWLADMALESGEGARRARDAALWCEIGSGEQEAAAREPPAAYAVAARAHCWACERRVERIRIGAIRHWRLPGNASHVKGRAGRMPRHLALPLLKPELCFPSDQSVLQWFLFTYHHGSCRSSGGGPAPVT